MNISIFVTQELEVGELSTTGCHRIYKHTGHNLGKIFFLEKIMIIKALPSQLLTYLLHGAESISRI